MARDRPDGMAEVQTGLQVSRSGRVVKKPKQYETILLRGRVPRFGKWTLKDKRKLLDCLRRNDCVYNNANFVYKSMGAKQRQHVDEYLKRLRKKAARHSDRMRRKQPPILTWFQVADELTWLKADEDLYEAIGTMLNIFSVEANNMQEKNKILCFGNLYKYVKALQKEEKLPELTPAESVIILDCFQHLADTLRTLDCDAQTEFMREQYQKYFSLLYVTPAPKKGGKKTSAKTTTQTNAPDKTSQNTGQKPLLKAQLIKKSDKKKLKSKQRLVKKGESLAEGQGQSSSRQVTEDREADSPQQLTERRGEVSATIEDEESGELESAIGKDVTVGEKGTTEKGRLPSGSPDSQGGSGSVEALDENNVPEDLDPDSPDFLARFANRFSLGSLNPFEIPTDLLYMRKKGQKSGDEPAESSSFVPVDRTTSPVESRGSITEEEEASSSQEDEDIAEIDLTKENSPS